MSKVTTQGPMNVAAPPTEQLNEMGMAAIINLFKVPNPEADFVYLSPEFMLDYVSQQLQDKDQDIKNHMQAVEDHKKLAEQISLIGAQASAAAALNGLPAGAISGGTYVVTYTLKDEKGDFVESGSKQFNTKEEAEAFQWNMKMNGHDANAPNTYGASAEQQQKAQALLDMCTSMAAQAKAAGQENLAIEFTALANKIKNGESVSKTEFETLAKNCETMATSLSSSAEMTMIKLQQLMQDRSRLLMFVTNALKAMDEPQDQAVRNLT